ncbi:phosphonoacetaldehyde dehydrogenase [Mesorhizobium sp. B2-2-4]|uniref:phosphonoacetaldehyde dehydrogenase n=1 Tax=unclassified Mesorhizobium TaxID=325217 RepID=UPI001127774D|nr:MULTISPECIES: phosphonoacetaldehyde dehydrogenase [unclassified Mesorhizobium]MBZ9918518.1 phosphonoacetaldehyde dehydrogenase [Mesorhizobium sp. BR1-1-7]MBZ9972235.1 phosphonoacetaldehyde dehydrogenase [Mesorhizobium sp. BR1-1-12]TPM09179.1 phosphonoacetaldehyde dehydrogenase [Mesorhizobium sp. B2-3-8]TPM18751.1 phosphonoacetaldehyde dehydrogenase [Mesorhizobium sp. B2-3-7]TPM60824.1 phosphonoacetaldehyde dehydrogenase [Mesorhizobium sp. B2-2-4]
MTKLDTSIKVRHEPMRIAGRKVDADGVVPVHYPYTNAVIGTVPAGRAEHARQAFEIAAGYRSKLTRYERQQILFRTAEKLASRREEISDLITLELGISKTDSLYEVGRAYDVFTLSAQMCIQDDGQIFSCDLTPHGKARKIFTTREPLKAISAITPFNHPLNMVSHKVAPAIATNNCVVVKPTELTPMTALLLADILYEAGLPPEMLSVVTGWPADIGNEMITNDNIDLITFTGGVPVGKMIARTAGYKRQVLELGGNDPLIVLNDLSDDDLARAADLAVAGATKNSGQRCTAVKRILVQESVADRFVPLVLERARKIRFGDPMDRTTDLGTVVHEKAAALFEARVHMAAGQGAEILYNPGRQGALLPPIVVDRVPHTSELVMEETFGPIIPIVRAPDDDEALIRLSNSTAFGLSSGVCTNSFPRMQKYITGLEVGTVNIWEVPGYRIEMSPFGGIKDSGNGYKEGVIEAMKSYTNVKTFSLPWS